MDCGPVSDDQRLNPGALKPVLGGPDYPRARRDLMLGFVLGKLANRHPDRVCGLLTAEELVTPGPGGRALPMGPGV